MRRSGTGRDARGWIGALLLFGAAWAACSSSRACRDGTLFVTIQLGTLATSARTLELEVVLDGVAQAPVPVAPDRALAESESFELSVPNYASHQRLGIVAVARDGAGVEVGRASSSAIMLTGNCQAFPLSFMASTPTGGTSGSSGGGVGTGGLSTGGITGVGGTVATGGGHAGSGGGHAGIGGGHAGIAGMTSGGAGGRGGHGGAPTTSCRLNPDASGFTAATSNAARVQGWLYAFDSLGANITLTPMTAGAERKLCVSGAIAKVTDGDFATHHGAAVGFDVCNPGGGATALTLGKCTLGTQLTGVQFVLTGPDVPPELRVVLAQPGVNDPAYALAFPGVNTIRFAEARPLYNNAAPAVVPANIQSVNFTVPSSGTADVPFDFCIEQLMAINEGACAAGGAGGAPAPYVLSGFDASTEGVALSNYVDGHNIGVPGSTAAKLAWDGTVGNPSNGSLRLEVTFSAYDQYVDGVVAQVPMDLRGRLLRAKVKLDSGAFAGGMTFHAGSGDSFSYAAGPYISPVPGLWTELSLDLRTVDGPFDPSKVVQLGIQFNTGAPRTPNAPFPGPQTNVFHIDTISY